MTLNAPGRSPTVIVIAIVTLAVLLALGGLAATASAERARALAAEQAARAEAARAMEAEQRARAEAAKAQAVSGFLTGVLTSADPAKDGADRGAILRDALDDASRKLDDPGVGDKPEVEASLRAALADAYAAIGRTDDAELQARKALEARTKALGSEDPKVVADRQRLEAIVNSRPK